MKPLIYKIKNIPAHLRALVLGSSTRVGKVILKSQLSAKILDKDGKEIADLGVISRRVITTAGVNYIRDDFANAAGSADITNFKYHGTGTGTASEAIGDTALGTEVESRVAGTQDNSVSKQYKTVATINYTATRSITEHGIFSASTSGTLLDRSVFSAQSVTSGQSIQFTYILTIADGG